MHIFQVFIILHTATDFNKKNFKTLKPYFSTNPTFKISHLVKGGFRKNPIKNSAFTELEVGFFKVGFKVGFVEKYGLNIQ